MQIATESATAKAGLGALALGLVIAAGGCRRCSDTDSVRRVRVEQGKLLTSFGVRATAGARGLDGRFAVGTAGGGVLVDLDRQRRVRLLADIGQRQPKGSGAGPRPEHDGAITSLAFSPDGRYLLSVGGHSAIWWDVGQRRMVRQVRGPFDLTAGTVDDSGRFAFFGNSRGHVYRWARDDPEAKAVAGFFCRPMPVPPERRRLDPDKRCRVGHYSLEGDQQLCLYPVTQIVRRGKLLARACREGTVGVMDLRTRRIRWSNLAGHLTALAFVGDGQLLFGRHDGELRLWDTGKQRVANRYLPSKRPTAVASDGELLAAAQGDRIRIWRRDGSLVVGAVTVPLPVVWLRIGSTPSGPPTLEALLQDGRLVAHSLDRG